MVKVNYGLELLKHPRLTLSFLRAPIGGVNDARFVRTSENLEESTCTARVLFFKPRRRRLDVHLAACVKRGENEYELYGFY